MVFSVKKTNKKLQRTTTKKISKRKNTKGEWRNEKLFFKLSQKKSVSQSIKGSQAAPIVLRRSCNHVMHTRRTIAEWMMVFNDIRITSDVIAEQTLFIYDLSPRAIPLQLIYKILVYGLRLNAMKWY